MGDWGKLDYSNALSKGAATVFPGEMHTPREVLQNSKLPLLQRARFLFFHGRDRASFIAS